MTQTAPMHTANAKPKSSDGSGLVLQRKCACGSNASALTGQCEECGKKSMFGVQTKLAISEPGDRYEQEADRIADQVMRMPAPSVQRQATGGQATEERLQTKPLANQITPLVQRETMAKEDDEDEEEMLQAKGVTTQAPSVTHSTGAAIQSMRQSGGQPLDPATRAFMEPRFGHDLSQVRIHTEPRAAAATGSLNARAFTLGQDIFFNQGEFDSGSDKGKRLLAHELVHTVQQENGRTTQAIAQCKSNKKGEVIGLILYLSNNKAVFLVRTADGQKDRKVGVHFKKTLLPGGRNFTGSGTSQGFTVKEEIPGLAENTRTVITFSRDAARKVRNQVIFPSKFPIEVRDQDDESEGPLAAGGRAGQVTGLGGTAPPNSAEAEAEVPSAAKGPEGDGAVAEEAVSEEPDAGSSNRLTAINPDDTEQQEVAAFITVEGPGGTSRFVRAGEIEVGLTSRRSLEIKATRIAVSALRVCFGMAQPAIEALLTGGVLKVHVPSGRKLREYAIDPLPVFADMGNLEAVLLEQGLSESNECGEDAAQACIPFTKICVPKIKVSVGSTANIEKIRTVTDLAELASVSGLGRGAMKKLTKLVGRARKARATRRAQKLQAAVEKYREILKAGGRWEDLTPVERKLVGTYHHNTMQEVITSVARSQGMVVLNNTKLTRELIEELQRLRARVIVIEGGLRYRRRVDYVKLDFAKKRIEVGDLVAQANPKHQRKTMRYLEEIEKLTGLQGKAIEYYYIGANGELLEELAQKVI